MSKSKLSTMNEFNDDTQAEGFNGNHRNRIQMVKTILLIWLDTNIDHNDEDCCNTLAQLRRVVSSIKTFKDVKQCLQYLKETDVDNVSMIVSGSLGQNIIPCVQNIPQVDAVFVFCANKPYHEKWAQEWSKIKGVFTDIAPICDALKQSTYQCEQLAISMSFMPIDKNSQKNLHQLDSSFMYIQIMKEILLDIQFEDKHFNQYIEYCSNAFVGNDDELKNVNEFEKKYRDKSAIWWYTFDCFLYPMINRALRLIDVDIIIKMGFFIKDLHQQIEKLHKEQFIDTQANENFVVYRGQEMCRIEYEKMTKTQGGLLSFNNFLSTSKDRSVALRFANRALKTPDLIGVLFVITINPSKSTTPFAAIQDVSAMKDENEVLFAMQTVLCIDNLIPIDGSDRLFQVELTLTNDDDKDLRCLTDYIRKETYPDKEGWYRLGSVLLKMGQFHRAEEVYQILLEQTTDEDEKGPIYQLIGRAKDDRGKYEEAITFYEKAVEIYTKNLPSNNRNLASCYNNLGVVYDSMSEYMKALTYYEKSLEIQQQTLPANHPDLASLYGNMGVSYSNISNFSKSLTYYEQSLEIQKQTLPPNHPDLALAYGNIALTHRSMRNYSYALSFLEKTIAIQEKALPPNHPDLATSYNNIGLVYDNMNDYPKALSFYEKSLEIRQHALPPNHPDLAASYDNLGLLYEDMGDCVKAHSFYQRAVNVTEQSLPADHPNIRKWKNNLERIEKQLECSF